jgi:hypothetical protein
MPARGRRISEQDNDPGDESSSRIIGGRYDAAADLAWRPLVDCPSEQLTADGVSAPFLIDMPRFHLRQEVGQAELSRRTGLTSSTSAISGSHLSAFFLKLSVQTALRRNRAYFILTTIAAGA